MELENYENQKSAFIAIVGRPNVGKSSILNKLLGQKIAIVSSKPQTTRTRIMGVLTEGDEQIVFIDTPGLVKAKSSLGEFMVKSVNESVAGVDACMLVVEADTKISKADEELTDKFKKQGIPAILVINKIDLLPNKTKLMEQIIKLNELCEFSAVVPVSA
ncbi:MAG: GTPase Era, partial [Oscillospiraceae bacterium]